MLYYLPAPTEEQQLPHLLYVGTHDYTVETAPRMLHSHANMVEINIIQEGNGTIHVDGHDYQVTAGDLIIYNSNVLHLDDCGKLLICGTAGISLPDLPPNFITVPGICPVFQLKEHRDTFIRIVQSMVDIAASNSPSAPESCQYLFLAYMNLILDLVSERQTLDSNPLISADSVRGHGREIQAYIDQHISEKISLTEIATHFDLSPSYVSRIFKLATGHNLNAYQTQRRIGWAQNLLLTTNHSMAEIAEIIGYSSQGYFSKQFQETIGITPMQYRKQFGGRSVGKNK